MNPGTLMTLKQNLKSLRLSTMGQDIEATVRHAKEGGISHEEFLLGLTETELQVRLENRQKRRLREAKFPLMKPLETFDLESAPDLDNALFRELATCNFIKEKRNIVFLGRSGTGKTHMATALGIESCQNNYKTRFVTGYGLVNELIEARKEKDLTRVLQRYTRYDALILDELGYVPFSKEGAELLFQVLAERHERGSVIITTNLGFADWTQIFGNANMTAALLDRITHKAHIINCVWKSYRLKETLRQQ
ncbi:MAG: ATP-binding protein [Desulfobulbaceae bacterium]|nr:ATP-binding protein [Desulfobulbaceae bacterium]